MKALQGHGWIVLAGGLGIVALWQPIILYLIALSVFGLPHVLWEMAWVRRVWGASLPRMTCLYLLAALLLQACARFALWFDRIDAPTAAACDTATLALALLATLTLRHHVAPQRRRLFIVIALLIPAALIAVADTPHVLMLLFTLAIAHNFTPIALVPRDARIGRWPARTVMIAVFTAPLLLFAALWALALPFSLPGSLRPAEFGWAQSISPRLAAALLPALVWAQCLHYLAVIYLMPRSIGQAWKGLPLRPVALAASGLLLVYFTADFKAARGLYAVAAGVHAWLEWPLILLALSGFVVRWAPNSEHSNIGSLLRQP
jgi:hypothetical protein